MGIEIDVHFPQPSGAEDIRTTAKIDTGAQHCVMDAQFGELLGLEIEDGLPKVFQFADGSRFEAYGHTLTFVTLGITVESIIYFSHSVKRNVLGRQGWLDKVRLALSDYDCTLHIAEYDT